MYILPNFQKGHFPASNFDQMLTFNCSPFHHFVEEDNGIWYPGRVIIKLLGYQIAPVQNGRMTSD